VPIIVKVADNRNDNAALAERVYDVWNCGGRMTSVHSDADKLRTGASELLDLQSGAFDVHGVGVGHRLDDDRVLAADFDTVYIDRY
jgi:hypothetical protein